MLLTNCLICNQPNPDNRHFWREHKINLESYILQYIAKKDLYDQSLIQWKGDLETYELTDFNSKANLRAWLNNLSDLDAQNYCIEAFKKRKVIKNLKFVPCEVELKSLILPPTQVLDRIFAPQGFYKVISETIGLQSKFTKLDKNAKLYRPNSDLKILVDTRETKPLKFKNLELKKLDYGDYCRADSPSVFFERKGLSDLIGTLSQGYERFLAEIERAENDKATICVLVECPINTALTFDKLPIFKTLNKITPKFFFHQIREISQKYGNIQFLFTEGRADMAELIPLLAVNEEFVKTTDLEYARTLKII